MMRDFNVTPYKLCVSILISILNSKERQNGKMLLCLLNLIRQSEFTYKELLESIQINGLLHHVRQPFNEQILQLRESINGLYDLVGRLRDLVTSSASSSVLIERTSVAGIYLRKVTIYFEKLSSRECSDLYDYFLSYTATHSVCMQHVQSIWTSSNTPNITTKSKRDSSFQNMSSILNTPGGTGISSTTTAKTKRARLTHTTTRSTRATNRLETSTNLSYLNQSRSDVDRSESSEQSQLASQALTTGANFGSQLPPTQNSDSIYYPGNNARIPSDGCTDKTQRNFAGKPTQLHYLISHQVACLQANEMKALNPRELYEEFKRHEEFSLDPSSSRAHSDAIFLRYLNLLRTNEFVASKQLLMAYFDGVSDNVSRSYSALNCSIWYFHFGHLRRAIECLQECFCCAQSADDEKCLLISLMWLSRIVIAARQHKSSKFNVYALLNHINQRAQELNLDYVQAMVCLTLEQLIGPSPTTQNNLNFSTISRKNARTTKNCFVGQSLQRAEILAVKHCMNDVLSMFYTLQAAHYQLIGATQLCALTSQVLLHFDLIEKCGDEDVLLVNENTFIAIRNLAFHVWDQHRDLQLVYELLIELCSNKIPPHRTDYHAILRQALAQISFEHHLSLRNWHAAREMVDLIRVYDCEGAELCRAQLLVKLHDEPQASLAILENVIHKIDKETEDCYNGKFPNEPPDGAEDYSTGPADVALDAMMPSEQKAYIKAKALLLRATISQNISTIFDCLRFVTKNKFYHLRTSCLLELARHLNRLHMLHASNRIVRSIMIDVLANGTLIERHEAQQLLNINAALLSSGTNSN